MSALPDDRQIVETLEALALAAGREIETVRRKGFKVLTKADSSPVTRADRRGEQLIVKGLQAAFPDIPRVAEEESAGGKAPKSPGEVFFLVDALDGTKEFVGGSSDFTVNIALVRKGVPEIGVVYAPAHHLLYSGRPGHAEEAVVSERHKVVSRRQISVHKHAEGHTIVASREHRSAETDAFIARHPGAKTVMIGSSLKFCLLARGDADLYPRFGPTMEWDTAAGDAVLRAAGGTTRQIDGGPLTYGKCDQAAGRDFANPPFISRTRGDG